MSLIKVGSSVIKVDAFSNKHEVVTTESTSVFNTNFDISSTAVVVYIDGVRQQSNAYSVTGARQITLSEAVVAGTNVAITSMDTDPVDNLAAKANVDSPTFTGNVGIGTTSPSTKLQVGSLTESTPATYTGNLKVSGATQTTLESVGGIELPVAVDGYGIKIQALSSSGAALSIARRNSSATWTESMRINASGNVGIGTSSPGAKLDLNGGLNVEDRMQIWRWAGNMSASSAIRLLDHTSQWLQSYCMVFVKVSAGWQNAAIWDVFCDGYGTYSAATKKMGDSGYHTVTTGQTSNYGYINLNNLHTAQVAVEVNVYSFSSYAVMNYTSSYMTLA